MTSRFMGGIAYDLADGPIGTEFGRDPFDGTPQQRLALGEGSNKLSISLTTTTVEGVDDLMEALARVRDDKIRQAQIKQLPEVA